MAAAAGSTIPIPGSKRWQARAARLSLGLRQRCNQAWLAMQWWLRPDGGYQPLLVLATQRSGSNLLMDYLRHVGGVQCHSEVLCTELAFGLPVSQCTPTQAIRHVRRSLHALTAPVRACKLMLDQLAKASLSLDALHAALPRAKYIVLYRESLAEQYLSRESALATQQWYLLAGQQPKQVRLLVSTARLKAYCEEIRQAYRTILNHAWLPERSVLLSYEELHADPAYWLGEQICPLLGMKPVKPQTIMFKQNRLPLAERVENYGEVAALLASPLCRQHYGWRQRASGRRAA